jgi:hypothetical protein
MNITVRVGVPDCIEDVPEPPNAFDIKYGYSNHMADWLNKSLLNSFYSCVMFNFYHLNVILHLQGQVSLFLALQHLHFFNTWEDYGYYVGGLSKLSQKCDAWPTETKQVSI